MAVKRTHTCARMGAGSARTVCSPGRCFRRIGSRRRRKADKKGRDRTDGGKDIPAGGEFFLETDCTRTMAVV